MSLADHHKQQEQKEGRRFELPVDRLKRLEQERKEEREKRMRRERE
jgi:hypothetical protein